MFWVFARKRAEDKLRRAEGKLKRAEGKLRRAEDKLKRAEGKLKRADKTSEERNALPKTPSGNPENTQEYMSTGLTCTA